MQKIVINVQTGEQTTVEITDAAEIASLQSAPLSQPSVVSMRQARLALLQAELLNPVNASILAGSEADKITWEYATVVNRSDSLVQNLAIGLGLSETDLDNLFLLASSL